MVEHLSALVESSAKPDVIVLVLPIPLIEKLVNAKSGEESEGAEEEEEEGDDLLNFRDLLKAKTNHLDVPTQIVWPDTWDDAAKIPRKVKRESNRQTQAKATRAWNLLNALFYKAGKVPWRQLPRNAAILVSSPDMSLARRLAPSPPIGHPRSSHLQASHAASLSACRTQFQPAGRIGRKA
jgi:hypothetical protein